MFLKMGFSYPNLFSLTPRPFGVEKAVLSVIFAYSVSASAMNGVEARPVIQDQLRFQDDYREALVLEEKQKWPEAAIILKNLIRKNPNFSEGVFALANALVYQGRREEGLMELEQALAHEKNPRKKQLYVRKIKVLARLFMNNETLQLYQDGLNLMWTQKTRLAEEKFTKALQKETDNAEILTRLGQCLVMVRDFDSAAERLKLARKLDPFEPEIRLWLGRALHEKGELSEAGEELRSSYEELGGKSELVAVWLADALYSLGQRAAAIRVLDEDVKNSPLHLSSLLSLARLKTTTAAINSGNRDPQPLWSARKDLQLILSRLPDYSTEPATLQRDLSFDFHPSPEDVKDEAQKLFREIENRLEDTGTQKS